jgi:adenylate cyclase class 2
MKPQKIREVEVKLRLAGPEEAQRRLRGLGARRVRRVFEENTLYDTRKSELWRSGQLLRLRLEKAVRRGAVRRAGKETEGVLTFKGAAAGRGRRYKVREETEVVIENPHGWETKLAALGLRPSFRYEKLRTSYRLPGLPKLHLELDETPVGLFFELEGAKRDIRRAARLLRYAPKQYITATYWALYRDFCRRQGRKPTNMVF